MELLNLLYDLGLLLVVLLIITFIIDSICNKKD